MPEELARRTEVRDGMIIHRGPGSPLHDTVVENIYEGLELGRKQYFYQSEQDACVARDLEVLASEKPLHVLRPDVVVYREITEPRGRWGSRPTVRDTMLVLEVVSATTDTTDSIVKQAVYARLGIPNYWIVHLSSDESCSVGVEMLTLGTLGTYLLHGHNSRHRGAIAIDADGPLGRFELCMLWPDLDGTPY